MLKTTAVPAQKQTATDDRPARNLVVGPNSKPIQ